MMRVALSEVVACTVDFFDLLFVEKELPEIVLVVDLMTWISVILWILLCNPHCSSFEVQIKSVIRTVFIFYSLNQIGQPPVDIEVCRVWLFLFDAGTMFINGIAWILCPPIVVKDAGNAPATWLIFAIFAL